MIQRSCSETRRQGNHAYLPQNSDGTLAKLFGIIVLIQNKQPPNLYFDQ